MRVVAPRHFLILIAGIALLWAAAIWITGGFVLQMPWGRLSSSAPLRAFTVGLLAAAWYAAQFREHADADLGFLARVRWPSTIAALASLAAFAIGVRSGTFVASSSDASGYVSQAAMWLHGRFEAPMPGWVDGATWPDAAYTAAPLGYRPALDSRGFVPTYPPGLPMLMAAGQSIVGPTGVYLIVPLLGAVAAWATFLLGRWLAGPWPGAVASVLLVASPVFLIMLVQPMSDVPVAAFWALALVGALGRTGASVRLAGAATSLAIITRPNLLPLTAVVAALVVVTGPLGERVRRASSFAATSAISVVFIAALNWCWYGSPLRSGHGSLDELYALRQFGPNLERYSRWLLQTQTPLVFLFLAAPFVIPRTCIPRSAIWIATTIFPLASLAMYLLYNPFEEWWYLRFLLPAYPAMMVSLSAVVVVGPRLFVRERLAAAISAGLFAVILAGSTAFAREARVLALGQGEQRYLRVAEYARRLPRRSVFVGVVHTGSLRFYTRRDVLRWEALDPASLDRAVQYLRDRDYDVYLVADNAEVDPFRQRFNGMTTARDLTLMPPAVIPGGVVIYALGGSAPPPQLPMQSH